MTRARPLRFLALVIGLWIGVRAILLTRAEIAPASGTTAEIRAPSRPPPVASPIPPSFPPSLVIEPAFGCCKTGGPRAAGVEPRILPAFAHPITGQPSGAGFVPAAPAAEPAMAMPRNAALGSPSSVPRQSSRWSGSAWLLVRDGRGQASLAPGGTLGGSQAGARLLYRLGGGLSLSGRIYAPLRQASGAEAAAGIDWRPVQRIPLHLLAERRQDVGGSGRSAFAVTLYGGTSGRLPGGIRGEAYGQAGIVGIRSRDLFADGSARATIPLGPVEIGGGAWGAAQPGLARLDAGPSASYRLPVRGANLRVQADWRFRIAGDAAPGSGPALTVAADF